MAQPGFDPDYSSHESQPPSPLLLQQSKQSWKEEGRLMTLQLTVKRPLVIYFYHWHHRIRREFFKTHRQSVQELELAHKEVKIELTLKKKLRWVVSVSMRTQSELKINIESYFSCHNLNTLSLLLFKPILQVD